MLPKNIKTKIKLNMKLIEKKIKQSKIKALNKSIN